MNFMGTKKFNILDKVIAYWRLNKIMQYFNQSDKVLDFGCGHQSYLLNYLKGKVESGIGIDYDVDNRTLGLGFNTQKFRFQKTLPFSENSFSKVTLLAVLEHLDLPLIDPLFKELNRVLQKNGQIIITSPTLRSKPYMEFLANNLHLVSKLEIMDHKKYYSQNDLEKLAKDTGFALSSYQTFQFGLNSLTIFTKS